MLKKIILGLVAFVALVFVIILYTTSGITEAAERFFTQVQQHHYTEAYRSLSADFRQVTSQEQMVAFLKATGLDDYQQASWGNRSIEGNHGKLEGSITTRSGGAIPIVIKLIKGAEERWQIYSIFKPNAGLKSATPQ